jgi:8-amino-7-oxononanoate synthase
MRTVLVTGSDTGVGKTRVVAALARLLARDGARVQLVKPVETGRAKDSMTEGDAETAQRLAGTGGNLCAVTLMSFTAPLAPPAAAGAEGKEISFADLVGRIRALEPCDWRIVEGAGGIATPIDVGGRDWADFAAAIGADALIVVVPDRLGAINQARLAFWRAAQSNVNAGVWLNALTPIEPTVAASTREGLRAAGVPLWAEQGFEESLPRESEKLWQRLISLVPAELAGKKNGPPGKDLPERCRLALAERETKRLRRTLRMHAPRPGELNLADNDYLALAGDLAVASAVAVAAVEHGASASASPLITGWREPHQWLIRELSDWHGFRRGLLWTSGYAANSALLSLLPAKGDLVLADRLIHHSMIDGLLRSGARLQRYEHLQLDQLEEMLVRAAPSGRMVFVVTETVFSMEGDFPDLARLAELKRRFGFQLVVDEAHALGWYGPGGAGLARAAGIEDAVDVLVGTLGKTLASGGAYTLFRDEAVRDYVVNHAGEFIYSTAISPLNVAAASAALRRVQTLASEQPQWHARSREFRVRLRTDGWAVPEGDSPIVPVKLDSAAAAVEAAEALRAQGILAAAVRPPTVPGGTSRLRFSLKRTFDEPAMTRVLTALNAWRMR